MSSLSTGRVPSGAPAPASRNLFSFRLHDVQWRLPDGSAFMSAALRSSTADELRGVLAARLVGQPPDAIDLGAQGGRFETSGSAVAS